MGRKQRGIAVAQAFAHISGMPATARSALALLAIATGTNGCTRAAPEPELCLLAATRWHGLQSSDTALVSPRTLESVRQMTLRCITEPFDREFVNCVISRGPSRFCEAGRIRRR